MLTSPASTPVPRSTEQIRTAALDRLREGTNPFAFSVATAGTEQDCLTFDVPELFDAQRADLLAVVQLYRDPKQPSRVYPVLGDAGTGKTHLLTTFQAELQHEANESGRECSVENLSGWRGASGCR